MEKQALALVKALKEFRVYILRSHIVYFVPHTVVKDILSKDPDGKRGKWIATILEYDLEIRPTKLVKQALTQTPVLISLDFTKYFYIFLLHLNIQ